MTAERGDCGAGPRRAGLVRPTRGVWAPRGTGAAQAVRRLWRGGGKELCRAAGGRAGASSGGKSCAGCAWAVSRAAASVGLEVGAHAPMALLGGWVLGEEGRAV